MYNKLKKLFGRHRAKVIAGSTVLLLSCATDSPDRNTREGVAVGAITGAVIGHQIHQDGEQLSVRPSVHSPEPLLADTRTNNKGNWSRHY